jgi:hypothetical protein
MINSGQIVLREAPWLTMFPGAAIALTVLAFNLLGDAIRDALDPAVRDAGAAPAASLDASLPAARSMRSITSGNARSQPTLTGRASS